MATVIAFDFGVRSIGLAIGQNITHTAYPLKVVLAKNGIPDWQKIEEVLTQWKPDYLVVGLPLNMDATEQPLTKKVRKFANELNRRFNYPVEMQDERLTTVEAKAHLFDRGGYRALQKNKIDTISAVLILESWFKNH